MPNSKQIHVVLACLLTFFGMSGDALNAAPAVLSDNNITVQLDYKGRKYIGKPVAWDGREVVLLRRDGRIAILPASSQSDFKHLDDKFVPMSRSTVRNRLVKEFGKKYQVSMTSNFIVVHPHGDSKKWASPFETLYQRFRVYFTSRGVTVDKPKFPMVAVVLRTRGEFDRFLKSYHDYDRDILGYYSPRSNRIITFDQSGGQSGSASWLFNASTVIHEATHQTAFNTGVHTRYGPVPRWISEGLAMMFEAPGVNNSNFYSKRSKRINRERLISLKYYYSKSKVDGNWMHLVANDNLFRSDPSRAYAMSWGLTFYLAETNPRQYIKYLKNDASRGNFEAYGSKDRRKDFARFFGNDTKDLEARMRKFYENLEIPNSQPVGAILYQNRSSGLLDEPLFDCPNSSLGSIIHVQLSENVLNVFLHRLDTDTERLTNLSIA